MQQNGRFTLINAAKIIVASLLFIQSHAWAECHFGENGEGGTSTIVNTAASTPLYFTSVNQFSSSGQFFEIGGPYDAQLSPALWSRCDKGDEGEQMSNITYDAISSSGDDTALWPTNVEGIYYAVRIYSDLSNGSYFRRSNGQWMNLGVSGAGNTNNWRAQIKLYQENSFLGNFTGTTRITPKESKKIGGMSIGGHTDSDNQPWWFQVTTSTFSIPVTAATCQAAVADNDNNVDFGETLFSSLREVYLPSRTFNIQLRGCNNVVAVKYKVASSKTINTRDGLGLANTLTSDAAEGIGVVMQQNFSADPSGHGEPFINDPDFITVYLDDVGTGVTTDLNFTTWLSRTDQPLKAGNFKAIGTFTFNYY